MYNFNVIDIEQRSQEWFDFRKNKIGSSMASTIMGENPWETLYSLWEKTLTGEKTPINSAMQRGIDEEPKALQWFSESIGRPFKPIVAQSKENPGIIASLDGFDEEMGIGCEIKTPGMNTHLQAIAGVIPAHYQWQIYHQMSVTGAQQWWYVSWDGTDGVTVLLQRNEDKVQSLIREENKFLKCLETQTPPPISDRDWFSTSDIGLIERAERMRDLDATIFRLEAERKDIRDSLIESAQSLHPRIDIGGGLLKVQKMVRKGNIDYDRIEVLKSINLEKYRKDPIVSWKVS